MAEQEESGGGGWLSGAWSMGASMYNAAASAVNRHVLQRRWEWLLAAAARVVQASRGQRPPCHAPATEQRSRHPMLCAQGLL